MMKMMAVCVYECYFIAIYYMLLGANMVVATHFSFAEDEHENGRDGDLNDNK